MAEFMASLQILVKSLMIYILFLYFVLGLITNYFKNISTFFDKKNKLKYT